MSNLATADRLRQSASQLPVSWYCDPAILELEQQLLFARGNAGLVRDVVVDGRTIVHEGNPTGVDLPAIEHELRGLYRNGVKQFGGLRQAWAPLSASLQSWFEARFTCE